MDLINFENKAVRKVWHNDEWHFSIVDIIAILTDSPNPRKYWSVLKSRLKKEGSQLATDCSQLKMLSADGKTYKTDVGSTQQILRLVMSVPSPKAEPLKLWLAEQGKRTIDEMNDPEIAVERAREIYQAKGYPDDWILYRLKSIEIRKQLTDEWQNRGVKEGQEYSILTAEIAKATFGVTPSEHAQLKGLSKENLRDHMTNLELIFTMLGEEATRSIAEDTDAQGFQENHEAAQKGGQAAGDALQGFEKTIQKKVLSSKSLKGSNPQDLIE